MKAKMEEKHASPFTPDQESFLAVATNKKTAVDDITMSSLPGTPIAASTVMREKGTMKERVTANGKDSRGSLFGSNDPSLAQSSDSPQLMINPENIIQESPLEGADQGSSEDHLALSLEEKSSDNVEEFLRTHNVSGLLQKISLSQLSLSDKLPEMRQSLMSQASDTSLGILNLDSMQDISQELENYSNGKNQSGSEDREGLEKGEENHISDKEMKDAVNNILKASKKTNSLSSRGQNSTQGQRSPNSSDQIPLMSQQWEEDKPVQPQSEEGVTDGHMIACHNYTTPSEDKSQTNEGATRSVQRGYRTAPQVDSTKAIQRMEMPDVGSTATSALISSDIGKRAASVNGRSDGKQGPIAPKSDAPVSRGLESLDCDEEDEDNQIDLASLKAGLDQLDAMFFDPSPSSKSQRSGSGDGEESRSSSLQPSPKIPGQSREWPSRTVQHLRTDSQMSALSIDFAEVEDDQGTFLQDAFEDGTCESEIDTEDEIEAARKSQREAKAEMDDIVRPGIEGGSSGEEDAPPLPSTLEPRQSAEGVVAVSPVPGDGGGGGDGMSDRDSDSGTSIGERSPVRNGMVGSDRTLDNELGGDNGAPPDDRDIEGQTRSQPVGDGIVDNSLTSGRQVRFASHDDITRWTPSGSAFHSRLRRPRNSEMENGDESLFPPRSITPTLEDPSLLNSQFLQPSHASLSGILGDAGAERNQRGDSLLFSQVSTQPTLPVDGEASDWSAASHPRELERTLTPGASVSDESLPLRGCSLGSFGASPIREDSNLHGPKDISPSEDFLPLEAEGRSGSDASSKRSSRETGDRHSMRRYVPGESNSSATASQQINQVIYLDEDGKGVTDLAFRTSIPMMHKLGAVNPFESFDNQEAVERDIVNSIDFGLNDNEEFLSSDQAAAVLDADESEFKEANIFHQDEHMSPDACQEASDWSFHNNSHVTVSDSITGHEDFCRISLGSFFGKRTEALGSLSGSADIQRPTFGIDDMVSPPAREPVALVNVSQQSNRTQSHLQESSSSSSFSSNHRPNGEGGDSKGDESQDPNGSEDAEKTINGKTGTVNEDQRNEGEVTLGDEIRPDGRIGGTETPPLNLSDIAGIIGQISSKSNSEEILQKIIALSNKRSLNRQTADDDNQRLADGRKDGATMWKEKKTSKDTGDPSRSRTSAQKARHKVTDGKDSDNQRRDGREKRIKRKTLDFDDTNASTAASAVNASRPTQQISEENFTNKSLEVPSKRPAVSVSNSDTYVGPSETCARDENIDKQSHVGRVSATMEDHKMDSNRKETLNQSQNGSHQSHNLKKQEHLQRVVGVSSKKSEMSAGVPTRPSLVESVAGSTLENEDESWATSSSIRKSSVLSPRGFFKASGKTEREILSLSPHKLEIKKSHSSEEEEEPEEEISPILGTGVELNGNELMKRHYDHPSTLLREESEPDGEPNAAELPTVGVLSAIPKTSTSQNGSLPLPRGYATDNNTTTVKQRNDPSDHVASSEIEKGPLDPARSAVSLQSSSGESINGKGMFVVGQHKVKQLSASLLVQSFNDTLYPNSKADVTAQQTSPSHSHGKSLISGRERSGAISPQEYTTSSTLSSSEEDAGQRSPSPPPKTSVLTGLRPEEDIPPSTPSLLSTNKRQIGTLNIRLEIDGEESVGKVPFSVSSSANEIVDNNQLKSHVSAAADGSPGGSSYMAGQCGQTITLTSTQLPTLLTSKSMIENHLASRVVNTRPGSSLSLDCAEPRLSVQSLDSDRTSLSGHSVYSQHGPGLSSHSYLGDTFTNLGRRPHSYQSSTSQDFPRGVLQATPYIEPFRQAKPGLPYQWHQGMLTDGGMDLGVTREQVSHFPYSSSVGGLALPRQPSSYPVPQQQAPIMSVGTAPRGTRHSSLPYGSTHLGSTGLALPSDMEQLYPQFPVATGSFSSNVYLEQRPSSSVNGSYQHEYQRDPSSSFLNLPAHARFKGVCCVGIASHISLPLRNSSNRWLHCFMDIVQVTANGEEMPPEGHSTFIIKERTTVAPHGTEQIKVIFVPKHPGIYTALLHVGWSTVVANGDRSGTPHVPPQVVSLQALAETPCVEILEDSDVCFGEMVHRSSRSRSLHLINKGRCTVPIRLLVTSSSSSYSCFSVSTGEKRSDVVTATYQRGSSTTSVSPVHISLKGHPGSNNDDIATATTIWVHFKAPPQRKQDADKKDAETYSARLDVEMNVPEKVMTLHSVNLRAVVGSANLHIPRKMHTLHFSASVGSVDRLKLPLKNSGSIRLEIKFAISRAEELFSVHPDHLKLKPAEEASVEISYAPKKAPSAVESLLTMKVDADGPQYEVVMRGEGTIEEKASSKDIPCLFSNKQFLSWGGVAIGRALQQKIVLRNSSSSLPLKLKVSITGGPDFQLQSSFGSQLQLTDSKSLIIKPEEDLPVNILYAPTMVTAAQGLLVMKPVGGCSKYTVPLSGYGGISSVSVEDLQTVGETSVLAVGDVVVGHRKVFTMKVSNNGDRAAFVKVICFSDLKTKVKLPKTHLKVEPHEFVIPAKAVETLSIVYQPTERDAALCYCQSSMVAAVALFSGDEVMRKQYQKALEFGQTHDHQMSADNPLRGVLFDKKFLKEKEKSECILPSRPNDVQLFYSCMSRLMVAIVGDASSGSQDSDQVNGIDTSLKGDPLSTGARNRSGLISVSPPVKGTPSHHQSPSSDLRRSPSSGLSSNGSTSRWALHPDHVILTWSPVSNNHSQGTGRIYFCNYTERKLSFELTWPGHILTVTPQNGMVEPNEQKILLVSSNPSIQSKGVILPWSGTIYVSCDNQKKEIKVQIREDLALDTSILPASSKQPQSLSTEPSTPAVQRRPLPNTTVSPKELKVRSKVIRCQDACVGQKTEFIFEFENTKPYPMKWSLSSFAPAYLKQADGTVCRTMYSVFRFQSTSGEMTPGQKMQLSLDFMPREEGDYSQFWDLESSSSQNLVSHKTRIELSGHGLPRKPQAEKFSRTAPKQNLYEQALAKRLSRTQPVDLTKASKLVPSSFPSVSLPKATTMPAGKGQSTIHIAKKASIVVSELARFDRCEVGHSQTVTVRLKNCSTDPQTVRFVSPQEPFSITHHEHVIKPRHYLKLPVTFHPKARGRFEAPFVIQTELQENLVVKLIGECL